MPIVTKCGDQTAFSQNQLDKQCTFLNARPMDSLSSHAMLVRQRTHLSASCSSRDSCSKHFFSTRPPRRSTRTRCQQQKQEAEKGSGHVKQKFEKYPDGPTQMDTPIAAYRRDIVAGKAFESVAFESDDNIRG